MDAWKVKIFTEFCIYLGINGYIDLNNIGLLCLYEECLIMAQYLGNISIEAYFRMLVNVNLLYKEESLFHEALEFCKKAIQFAINTGYKEGEAWATFTAGNVLYSLRKYEEAIEYYEKGLNIALEKGHKSLERKIYSNFASVYFSLGIYQKAIEFYSKSLNIALEIGDKNGEGIIYGNLGGFYQSLCKYQKAIEYYKKSLKISFEIGDKSRVGNLYCSLGSLYRSLGKYQEAIEHNEKSLNISLEIGDKSGEGRSLGNLGNVYLLLGNYQKAIEHLEKCLCIFLEIGDKKGEGTTYGNLGNVYLSLGKYQAAIEYHKKSLKINLERGYKCGEVATNSNLGNAFQSLGKYQEAIEYYKKGLKVASETGDKCGEGSLYCNLGTVYNLIGKHQEAIEYFKSSLNITSERGEKNEEGITYMNLGNVCQSLGKYQEAMEHYEKSLTIFLEIGYKSGEGSTYMNYGIVYSSLGKYQKAIQYLLKSISIALEIGNKCIEEKSHLNLGAIHYFLGNNKDAIGYFKKSLNIALQIGDKRAEGITYLNLGSVYISLGKHQEAIEYHDKSLNIALEIGDKAGEGYIFMSLGSLIILLKNYEKAILIVEKGLNIFLEIGDKGGEAISYWKLADIYQSIGKYQEALKYCERCLRIAKEMCDKSTEAYANYCFGKTYYSLYSKTNSTEHNSESRKNNQELSVSYLKESVRCLDYVFLHLHEQYDLKISIVDTFIFTYKLLTTVLIETQQIEEALLLCDRGRARALGDLLVSKYGIDKERTSSLTSLENLKDVLSNKNFTILFFEIGSENLETWVISSQRALSFKRNEKEGVISMIPEVWHCEEGEKSSLIETLRKVIEDLLQEVGGKEVKGCENRCLESFHKDDDTSVGKQASSVERDVTPAKKTQRNSQQNTDRLHILFSFLIAPLLQNLEQEEIVIIPDGPLYMVPFAALRVPKTGLFLSETKRFRLAPSLTTLKTLQECPTDYHCKKGALIVGDPDVGEVTFKGEKICFTRLPSAKHEAEIIGANLNVKPLIGSQATKQMVKHKLQEGVSIIHIAAHSDSDNGHIALAPISRTDGKSIPEEEDYMLTMQEVQEIGVRAQLVVLSCCHSGLGEIKSEGMIGMSRAFLAAGARAVVASLWAVDDDATRTFMVSFYMYLKMGDSASKSLQRAMTDVREEGYDEPKYWAPFFLIGDDVTISV